jgi:hypothetical protein
MEIPAFTSGFEEVKENKKKYASDSCVAFLYSSVEAQAGINNGPGQTVQQIWEFISSQIHL